MRAAWSSVGHMVIYEWRGSFTSEEVESSTRLASGETPTMDTTGSVRSSVTAWAGFARDRGESSSVGSTSSGTGSAMLSFLTRWFPPTWDDAASGHHW